MFIQQLTDYNIKEISDILSSLGFTVKEDLTVLVPNRRPDITIKEDLVDDFYADFSTFAKQPVDNTNFGDVANRLIIGENIPLDIQQLSKILGKSTKKVEQVLSKFINLRMISYEDNCFVIRNWSKYQSADKLEEIRKNNRERQRKFREKSKVESNVTETLDNNIE